MSEEYQGDSMHMKFSPGRNVLGRNDRGRSVPLAKCPGAIRRGEIFRGRVMGMNHVAQHAGERGFQCGYHCSPFLGIRDGKTSIHREMLEGPYENGGLGILT